jgi:DnaJ-domain-containing protein 1
MAVLERFAELARDTWMNLAERRYGLSQKPLSELTDAELEEELLRRRRERAAKRGNASTAGASAAGASVAGASVAGPRSRSPEEQQLHQYYANLELAPGASLDAVRRAYRELMSRYHPDKHLGDPERHKAATELAQSLTRAYTALVTHLGG